MLHMMGTGTLTFASTLLLFQVACGTNLLDPAVAGSLGNNIMRFQVVAPKHFNEIPIVDEDPRKPELDDAYENQLPPPPTMEMPADCEPALESPRNGNGNPDASPLLALLKANMLNSLQDNTNQEEDEPCDCEGGCDDVPEQVNPEPEETGCEGEAPEDNDKEESYNQKYQSRTEDQLTNGMDQKPKILIILKRNNAEDLTKMQDQPSPLHLGPAEGEGQPFQKGNPKLTHIIFTISNKKFPQANTIPLPKTINSLQETNDPFATKIASRPSEEGGRNNPSNQDSDLSTHTVRIRFSELEPMEPLLLHHLINIARKRSVVDRPEDKTTLTPPFAEPSNLQSNPILRMIILHQSKQVSDHQMSPFPFPVSGVHIITHTIGKTGGDDSVSKENGSILGREIPNGGMFQQQINSRPQEIPKSIEDFLQNLRGPNVNRL